MQRRAGSRLAMAGGQRPARPSQGSPRDIRRPSTGKPAEGRPAKRPEHPQAPDPYEGGAKRKRAAPVQGGRHRHERLTPMTTRQQGPGTSGVYGSTVPGRGRGRARAGPATSAERGNALALWRRALVLGAGGAVADPNGLPPSPMLDLLVKACRGRLQGHLFLPRRLDDAYLFRIVSMKERDLLRQEAVQAARTEPAPPIPPKG